MPRASLQFQERRCNVKSVESKRNHVRDSLHPRQTNSATQYARRHSVVPQKRASPGDVMSGGTAKVALSILGGCSDGELIEDADFIKIVEQFGGYQNDLKRPPKDSKLSLFEMTLQGPANPSDPTHQAVSFIQRYFTIFSSPSFAASSPIKRKEILLDCLNSTPSMRHAGNSRSAKVRRHGI